MPEKRAKPKACRMWAVVGHNGFIRSTCHNKFLSEMERSLTDSVIEVNVTPVTKRKAKRKAKRK